MNMQEFSHQLEREDHPSPLIQALRTLRSRDFDWFRDWWRLGPDWGVWTGGEPGDGAELRELQS